MAGKLQGQHGNVLDMVLDKIASISDLVLDKIS
jgi:hypothetical protein